MASKKKQKGMVFHQEGAVAPAAASVPDHSPACFPPKTAKASNGGMEQISHAVSDEADVMGKRNTYQSKEVIRTSGGCPAVKHPTSSNSQSDNLPPESICKGIRVTLDNNSMWNEFFRCKTEMILTKQGSRMFPYCRFRISGLNPSRNYSLVMDIQPLDNSHYKWTGKSWQVAGKAECHVKSQPFAHPESPSTGQHWMQNPVSFYKLKLTNNISDQDGNTILHPMHLYLPRLHVVQTDKAAKDIKLNGSNVVTFTFPQTEFMAVIAYQNSQFAQLKVNYNPFAKGLKEDGSSAWGLRLKLNSGKDSNIGGGTTVFEQHPVKKSLKSLLANHKPRSAKAADLKPTSSGDLQKNSTTNKDQSTAKVHRENLCSNSHPAQKLFSELMREAHVSLQRCNVEQLGINNSTSKRTEPTNTKAVALKSNRKEVCKKDSMSVKTESETSPAKKGEIVLPKRKHKEDKPFFNSLNCKDDIRMDFSEVSNVAASALAEDSSVDSDKKCKPEVPSEVNLKQHKRPAPLPLPALALFLKQHSTKSKKIKSKPDSPTSALPLESLCGLQRSSAVSVCLPFDHVSNAVGLSTGRTVDVTEFDNQPPGCTVADGHADEIPINHIGQVAETALQPSSLSCSIAVATTDSNGLRTESPALAERTLALPISNQPHGTPEISTATLSLSLTTSSASSTFPPPLDTVLPVLKSPQTGAITESSTLPSDSSIIKAESLLSDPECSSVGFEPMSPASSPEPLPSLPVSLGLELDTSVSGSTVKAPENLQHRNSAASVFKWHTVLPPAEPYIDTSFATFQPTPQPLPLTSISPPFLNSQSPFHPEPQPLHSFTPPTDPAPTFQENEQSLPFPAELSPLALQLPLSPTFSSLDGDGLSPTPSLADLVQFFSTDDDLGMGVEFSNTEAMTVPCSPPSTIEATAHESSQQVHRISANKTLKRKKKSRQQNLSKTNMDQKIDESSYAKMQPNLEEVEEQLFISFTSKEALRLHIADSEEPVTQTTPEAHLQPAADTPENADTAESLEQRIFAFEKIILRDLKQMKHRQVIHPVLQEVGLKMNLLDPTLAIDLQYLGVRLPIPPPGVSLEPLTQGLPPPQAFVSRTGKTTDMTQIKGWREKFTPSEAPSTPSSVKPEAGPSSDLPKKNLSAFCSDMLDEYLEHEGKLIDERAASFSQPQVEPVVYELPTRSMSYVRTLDSVLKKQPSSSPTSDLIFGFIPPSKRPKLSLKEKKASRKGERKSKGPKQNKLRLKPGPGPISTPEQTPNERNLLTQQPAVVTPADHTAPITEPHKLKKKHLKIQFKHTEPLTLSSQKATFNNRRKLKPQSSSQTLSPLRSTVPPVVVSEDMAPLESDSELGVVDWGDEPCRKHKGPVMTRALLRQKALEDGVVWEGRPRTCITKERATIALTSLFTLMGFVSENPTAPIQMVRKQAPPCLNEYCRLGCICSSLSHCSRISHCGRPQCMFGCSCLKQKVVLLKNLDGSDSSPSHHQNNKKRRKRRMKMAYILKEADSVSQPAERVQTMWKKNSRGSDPDPVHIPESSSLPHFTESRENNRSCARVRGFTGRKTTQKQKDAKKAGKSKVLRLESLMHRDLTLKEPKTKSSIPPAVHEPVQSAPFKRTPSPPLDPPPKPSKRLIILAECKWASDADRNHVLKTLCEAMAQDRLGDPFWIKKYLISPLSQTVEENGSNCCIQYKIHISTPKVEREKPQTPPKPQRQLVQGGTMKPQQKKGDKKPQQQAQKGAMKPQQQQAQEGDIKPQQGREGDMKPQQQQEKEGDMKPQQGREGDMKPQQQQRQEGDMKPQHGREGFTDTQQQAGPLEDWQQEVMEEEEEEFLEDWQREVEEDDIKEHEGSKSPQVDNSKETSEEEMSTEEKNMNSMGLPFLTGISPAGFLSANRKKRGGTDHVVQVNGKLYPLAKIQLGSMGALHPANRLAAYLTGRVGSNKDKQASSASSIPPHTSGLTSQTISSTLSVRDSPPTTSSCSTPPRQQLSVLTIPTSSTGVQVDQSAAREAGTRVTTVRVYPNPYGGSSQVRLVPATGSSAPTDSQVNTSVVRPVNPSAGSVASKGSPMLMVEVLGSLGKVPVSGPLTQPMPPTSISQRIVLQPVHTASGTQYYRRPDGKLVRLVPVSELRSGNPNLPLQRGPPPPRLSPPSAPLQTPAVTGKQTLPLATVTTTSTTTSTSTSSVSDLQSSVASTSSSLQPASCFVPQKGMCTLKILPAGSNKEPIIFTCPKVRSLAPTKVVHDPGSFTLLQPHPNAPVTPANLISLKPSTGGGAGLGVKTVTVSAAPVCSSGVLAPHKPAASQTCTTQSSTEMALRTMIPEGTPLPPPASDRSSPEPEVACGLVDLDIICVDDETMEVVNVGWSSSSETENSSDFESDAEGDKDTIKMNPRLLHNVLERKRRGQMRQLFEGLKSEVGMSREKTSKISALKKAVQVIKDLRLTDRRLERKKRRLTKRRDDYLSTIAPTTDRSNKSRQKTCRGQRLCESVNEQGRGDHRADIDLMEVMDLLDETDEPTDNSSDEETVVTKMTDVITITNGKEDEVQCVAGETQGENSWLNAAQRRLARMMRNSESSLIVKKTVGAPSDTNAYRALGSVLNTNTSPKTLLIEKACEDILTLQNEMQRLKNLKMGLNQQRDAYVTELSQRSGKSEQRVLRKLQQLSSKQKKMEKQERHRATNQLPAPVGDRDSEPPPAGDGASKPPSTEDMTDDNMIITSSEQQQTPHAPLTPVSIITPVHTPVLQSHMVLQLSNPVLTPPALVLRDKPRTMPNILSRSKNPAPPLSLVTNTVEGEAPSFQALVPTEVFSLVGAALPGQPVLTLSPLIAGPRVLQTTPAPGMAPVTLNVPNLTNQQLRLASLPRPPTGKIYSFSAPLTVTNVTATNFTNLLQLVQPQPEQLQLQQLQQQQIQQLQLHKHQQQVSPGQPPPLPPSLVVSAGSDQIKEQTKPQSQTNLRPESSSSPPSIQGPSSSPCPSLSKDGPVEVVEGEPVGPGQQQGTRGGGGTESLTSLLNEINYFNQQTVPTAAPAREVDEEEQDHPHSPWVLQLDSDSDDAVTMETDEVGITRHRRVPTNGNSKSCVLAPPPLLQMSVGGAKVVDPATSNRPAGGGGVGGGSTEGGVAWRPMPRLVPLGLRGNQTS